MSTIHTNNLNSNPFFKKIIHYGNKINSLAETNLQKSKPDLRQRVNLEIEIISDESQLQTNPSTKKVARRVIDDLEVATRKAKQLNPSILSSLTSFLSRGKEKLMKMLNKQE